MEHRPALGAEQEARLAGKVARAATEAQASRLLDSIEVLTRERAVLRALAAAPAPARAPVTRAAAPPAAPTGGGGSGDAAATAAAKASLKQRKREAIALLLKKTKAAYARKVDENYIAPYSPSPAAMVDEVYGRLALGAADVVYDLGCGDGRWLVGAARRGARGVGVECDAKLVAAANEAAAAAGLGALVEARVGDIFETRLDGGGVGGVGGVGGAATVVVVYAFAAALQRMSAMLLEQLGDGARVVCVGFHLKGWEAEWSIRVKALPVTLYVVGRQRGACAEGGSEE